MAAVQSAGRTGVGAFQSGIRPFDLSRDLRPVAELIAQAFAHELDDRGVAALREMRWMSRLGGLLSLFSYPGSELEGFFGGFVWLEEGKVVGNITVQRADKYGQRWQIANVAVAPAFRGRGISRRLMEQAVIHIRDHGGKWAVLQVYAENVVARTLYDHMGFDTVGGMTDLEARRTPALLPEPERIPNFHSFDSSQWQALYELANNQLGAQSQWWRSVRRSEFQTGLEEQANEWFWRSLGRRTILRRSIQWGQRFDAALILTAQQWRGKHRIQFWARPDVYGQFEASMLRWAVRTLADYPVLPITISVTGDHSAALEVLEQLGFRTLRTLVTMRLEVTPG